MLEAVVGVEEYDGFLAFIAAAIWLWDKYKGL